MSMEVYVQRAKESAERARQGYRVLDSTTTLRDLKHRLFVDGTVLDAQVIVDAWLAFTGSGEGAREASTEAGIQVDCFVYLSELGFRVGEHADVLVRLSQNADRVGLMPVSRFVELMKLVDVEDADDVRVKAVLRVLSCSEFLGADELATAGVCWAYRQAQSWPQAPATQQLLDRCVTILSASPAGRFSCLVAKLKERPSDAAVLYDELLEVTEGTACTMDRRLTFCLFAAVQFAEAGRTDQLAVWCGRALEVMPGATWVQQLLSLWSFTTKLASEGARDSWIWRVLLGVAFQLSILEPQVFRATSASTLAVMSSFDRHGEMVGLGEAALAVPDSGSESDKELRSRILGPLSLAYSELGRVEDAQRHAAAACEIGSVNPQVWALRASAIDNPESSAEWIRVMGRASELYWERGVPALALEFVPQLVTATVRVYGFAQAEALADVWSDRVSSLGPETDPGFLRFIAGHPAWVRGWLYRASQRYDEALEWSAKYVQISDSAGMHEDTIAGVTFAAECDWESGRLADAEQRLRALFARFSDVSFAQALTRALSLNYHVLEASGRQQEATNLIHSYGLR